MQFEYRCKAFTRARQDDSYGLDAVFERTSVYQDRLEKENCPAVRRLLEQDIEHLDRIQVMTASSRQFYIVLRIRRRIGGDIYAHLGNVEKYIHEQGFTVHRADRQELKKLLAVYYGQSISVDPYTDYDGQQWE